MEGDPKDLKKGADFSLSDPSVPPAKTGENAFKRKTLRTPRRVFDRPVGVLCRGSFFIVRATHLSEGGLGFISDSAFPAQSKVVISLLLPGGEAVVTSGEILAPRKDAESGQFAAKFLGMSLQLKRLIRNYVTAKTEAEAEMEAKQTAMQAVNQAANKAAKQKKDAA